MESPDRERHDSQRGSETAESPWHGVEIAPLLQEFDVDSRVGLNRHDAQRRLECYGYNELESAQAASPLTLLLAQFRNVLIIVLLAAAGLSAIVGEVTDAMIILIIVFFSAVLGFFQEYRAERAVEALKRMLAPTARVLRDGEPVVVSARELVPGDIMLLEAGDRVSADIRLLEAHALYCDEAPLTGESTPVAKQTAVLPKNTPIPERTNTLFGGTTVTYGRGKGVVTATGIRSQFGQIAAEVAAVEVTETPLEKRTSEIGKWLAAISLSVCALVVVISVVRGFFSDSLDLDLLLGMTMFAVALAVAAVPEALAFNTHLD